MSGNTVAAVVVTYNRLALLQQCVAHLRAQTVPCDILLIDNASNDGTGDWANSQTGLNYYNTGANLGGAGGFNIGMRRAVETGYDYVWVMDDDTLPNPDALEKLLEADKILSGDYGWLSSVALWTDGSECRMNRQKLKKSFYEYSPLLKYGLVQAEQATFVSLFLRSEVIHQVGLPIKEYFIWGDDIEFSRRIAVRGKLRSYVVKDSIVNHMTASNNGSNLATDEPDRIERYNYAFRNENHLYRQEGVYGILYYFAKCVFNLLKICFFSKSHRLNRSAIILRQFAHGRKFNPQVELLTIVNY